MTYDVRVSKYRVGLLKLCYQMKLEDWFYSVYTPKLLIS